MSIATEPVPTPAIPVESPEPPFWPISVAMYTEMVYAGIIGEKERVYLWNGRLASRMTVNRPHATSITKTSHSIHDLHTEGYFVESDLPMALRLTPSVPEPDVKVVRGRMNDYPRNYPTSADIPLVVEVADSSLSVDRKMAFTYAAEGIPIYWLVNIPGNRLEVFSEPAEGAYSRCTPFGPNDEVPVILDGHEVGRIRVRDLLP